MSSTDSNMQDWINIEQIRCSSNSDSVQSSMFSPEAIGILKFIADRGGKFTNEARAMLNSATNEYPLIFQHPASPNGFSGFHNYEKLTEGATVYPDPFTNE